MTLARDDATWVDTDGVRWLNPEIVLLFKAKHLRAKDRADFAAALPLLGEDQRAWLVRALAWAHPGHAWLARAGGGGGHPPYRPGGAPFDRQGAPALARTLTGGQ
ncbi:MAG: hypothetical protein ACXVYW_03660 [Oryzihumus sp.]